VVVIAGPVADTEDAAQEIVQDVVETTAARFQRDPADVEQFIPVENEARASLEGGCNNLCKILLGTIN
jgi:hypothetical protein